MKTYTLTVDYDGLLALPDELRLALGVGDGGTVTVDLIDDDPPRIRVAPVIDEGESFGALSANGTVLNWREVREIIHDEVAQNIQHARQDSILD